MVIMWEKAITDNYDDNDNDGNKHDGNDCKENDYGDDNDSDNEDNINYGRYKGGKQIKQSDKMQTCNNYDTLKSVKNKSIVLFY